MNVLDDPVALNAWYVVCFTREIAPGSTETTRLLGEELLLARAPDGRFDVTWQRADGSRAAVTQCCERHGFLWVSLGTPAHAVVEMPEFEDGQGRRFVHRGRIGVPSSGQRVIENFFDLSHFSFVHTGTLGGYEAAEVPQYEVEYRADGAELWATGCSFFQPKASAAAGGGAAVYYDYRIPSPFVAIIYKDSMVRRGAKDLIGLFVQPHDEESCTVHSFALLFDETNSHTHILHFYHEIFMQDRMVLVHQRPRKLPVHPQREVPATSDKSSIAYRRWLDRSGLLFGLDRSAS